jgi:hypothetical protein
MRRIAWMILAATCALVAACDKNTPLMDKVVAGDAAAVSALIAKGADVNASNNYGWTALSHAARAGNVELVKLLLAHGADVNARDQSGWTCCWSTARRKMTGKRKRVGPPCIGPPPAATTRWWLYC